MAMNGQTLGDVIYNLITNASSPATDQVQLKENINKLWQDIAKAIVAHIQQNAVVIVQPGIAVTTTGSAAAQAGATTATGTGSIA
jgi:L-lactate utilization protein LutC